ncbi:MAG: DNA starvation/stationary phase protection protein [Bradyrhizobiaceae bacterium]|nr:DNA starvation/stationary phase protection protein [Bradyrhizobiaceae bacterium]
MSKTNAIGLSAAKATQLSDELNELLANFSVFYQNVRGFHWNIRGEKFFELHAKFEELYLDLQLKIDEVAERVLTLGSVPYHTYAQFLESSVVKPAESIKDGRRAVQRILAAFTSILLLERELLELAQKSGDEGTAAMMSDYIRQHEKLVWMYSAFLG